MRPDRYTAPLAGMVIRKELKLVLAGSVILPHQLILFFLHIDFQLINQIYFCTHQVVIALMFCTLVVLIGS